MADITKIADELSVSNSNGSCELSKLLEEKWGVSAAAPVAAAAAAAAGGAEAAAEKTEFDVMLSKLLVTKKLK
jgi:large subunit ribosomal protein L7/L12